MERYEKYKDSGVEWIGEIPEGWEVKKFKYLYDLVTDKNELDLLKIGLENIESETGKFIASNTDFEGEGIHFKIDDILFGKLRPYLAKVYLAEFEGKAVGDFYVFRCKNKMDAKYSSNLILSKLFIDLTNSSTFGSKMPRVAWDIIANFEIPYPNLTEQTTIANYLDRKTAEIDQLIAQKEKLLCLYEEEKTVIINQAVTQGINPDVKLKDSGIDWLGEIPEHWGVKKSRYLFEIRKRIAGKLGFDILSITQKGLKVKDIKSNDGQMASDYSKYQIVKKDDFAMNHMDLLTGFIDIADQEGVTSPDYRVFSSIDNESNSKFYLFLFQMMYTRKIFYAFGRGAALFGRWRLPADEFKSFLFPCPSKSEQTAIVFYIETQTTRINAKIAKTKTIIALQKEYRIALISEVVTGKIKVAQEMAL